MGKKNSSWKSDQGKWAMGGVWGRKKKRGGVNSPCKEVGGRSVGMVRGLWGRRGGGTGRGVIGMGGGGIERQRWKSGGRMRIVGGRKQ